MRQATKRVAADCTVVLINIRKKYSEETYEKCPDELLSTPAEGIAHLGPNTELYSIRNIVHYVYVHENKINFPWSTNSLTDK